METRISENDSNESRQSFMVLLKTHEKLNALFYAHQEALLMLDVPLALRRLDEFQHQLVRHMTYEEEKLLPVYERAGRIPGGPTVFFTGEHKRMLEFLSRFHTTLVCLLNEPRDLKREIIELFDQQAMFKHLTEHHDQREQNILYPALDRVTSEAERFELLGDSG